MRVCGAGVYIVILPPLSIILYNRTQVTRGYIICAYIGVYCKNLDLDTVSSTSPDKKPTIDVSQLTTNEKKNGKKVWQIIVKKKL